MPDSPDIFFWGGGGVTVDAEFKPTGMYKEKKRAPPSLTHPL